MSELICPKCGKRYREGIFCPTHGCLMIGAVIGEKYRNLGMIGSGGFSDVYKVENITFGGRFACKILHQRLLQDEGLVKRFKSEAKAAALIQHENVVLITDFGTDQIIGLFIIMELLRGDPLDLRLSQGPLDRTTFVSVAGQVLSSLHAAHRVGIIHRDLKPSNIFLVDRLRGDALVKVLDFGIAKILSHQSGSISLNLTRTGESFGTPKYMSPEQYKGDKADERSDIYSLGIMMYEMLTGEPPFKGTSFAEMMKFHLHTKPPSMRGQRAASWVTTEQEEVIQKALAKKREDRFQSIEAFYKAFSMMFEHDAAGTAALKATMEAVSTQSDPSQMTIMDKKTPIMAIGQGPPGGPSRLEEAREDLRRAQKKTAAIAGATAAFEATALQAEPPGGHQAPVLARQRARSDSTDTMMTASGESQISAFRGVKRRRWPLAVLVGALLGTSVVIFFITRNPSPSEKALFIKRGSVPMKRGDVPMKRGGVPGTWRKPSPVLAGQGKAIRKRLKVVDKVKRGKGKVLGAILKKRRAKYAKKARAGRSIALHNKRPPARHSPIPPPLKYGGKKKATPKKRLVRHAPVKHAPVKAISEFGYLLVKSTPRVLVFIDNQEVGYTPVKRRKLKVGTHSLELNRAKHNIYLKTQITIVSGQTRKFNKIFGKGTLKVDARPWAYVYLKGKKLGTSLHTFKLYEGRHKILIENPALKRKKTISVTIRAGKLTRQSADLTR